VVLIEGRDGWYVYDGEQTRLIPGSAADRIGANGYLFDLPSINKAGIKTDHGLWERTEDGRLEAVPLPFPVTNSYELRVADFPPAKVGLIAAPENLYTLTRSGKIQSIRGAIPDWSLEFHVFAGLVLDRSAMLVKRQGLFLLMDASHPDVACADAP